MTGPDEGGFPAWLATSWALRLAGARPIRVTPTRGAPREPVDGVVLGGGADVDPSHYGEARSDPPRVRDEMRDRSLRARLRALAGYALSPAFYLLRRLFAVRLGGLDAARDALEMELLRAVEDDGAPVLGICRGMQLMNVFCGGSLHQELSSFYTESANPWTLFPAKAVSITPGSSLAEALGRARCRVNSLHRQAVGRLGEDLRSVAVEDSGVVQGIEGLGARFFVGVQWHPEYLPQRWEQRRLFSVLVRHARACAVRRSLRHGDLGAAHELVTDLAVPEEDTDGVDQPEHG